MGPALVGSLAADLGIGACAQALGQLFADLDLVVTLVHGQGLLIRVHGDEFHALEPVLDHAVHRVAAGAAHADDLDLGEGCALEILFKHLVSPFVIS